MIVYFNNCHGYDHAKTYGRGAFFDLNIVGIQATKAKDLTAGQQCIVASPAKDGLIVFNWFSFLRETVMQDDNSVLWRVFFGEPIRSDTLSKGDAARDGLYSAFFDKNCNFKRQSVLQR